MNELYVMGMITNRGIRSKMIPFFKEHHIHVTLSTMGVGTANSAILDYLGMEATEKTIYFAFVTLETWKSFKKELYSKMKIDIAARDRVSHPHEQYRREKSTAVCYHGAGRCH